MKRFIPWFCIIAATSQTTLSHADTGIDAYRQGSYVKALDDLSKQPQFNPIEAYYLGRMNLYGYGQLKNNATAIRYFTQAAEGGHPAAQGIMARYQLIEKKDPAQAFYWFKKSADAGDLQAQMFVAGAYLYGFGAQKNSDKARQYFIAAAKQGNSIAQYTLANYFLESRQASSQQLGLIWLAKAVAQNNPMAQLLQAKRLMTGKPLPADTERATQLIDLAITEGYGPAMIEKGRLAREKGDFTVAKEWIDKATKADYFPADLAMAELYLDEKSPFHDVHSGYLFTLKAAQNNVMAAQLALATLYKTGKGIEPNPALVKEWERKAHDNPSNSAMEQTIHWISNGKAIDFASSGYPLKGIFTEWTNPNSLKENGYNPGPKMAAVTRKMLYKPNFELATPNDIGIGDYYDALSASLGTAPAEKISFERPPMDDALKAIQAAADKKDPSLKTQIDSMTMDASLGNSDAEFNLGQIYQYGIGVDINIAEAIRNNELAAGQENLSAMVALAQLYIEDAANLKPDYSKGIAWLQNAAFKGNGAAQLTLADVLEHGLKNTEGQWIIQPDPTQSNNLLFLASANGSGAAQYRLAENLVREKPDDVADLAKQTRQLLIKSLYQSAVTHGVTKAALPLAFFNAMDPDKAKQSDAFKVAQTEAASDSPNAALLLGLMYDRGIGVESSQRDALYWYQKSGKNAVSDFILGTYYTLEAGANKEKGLALLQDSAHADFPYAHFNVAITQHEQDASFLPQLEKALALGNSRAGLLLADYYLSRATDPSQMKQARDIYQLFAKKGDKVAQLKLAFMHEQGLGGKIDPQAAFSWYSLSAEQGTPMAQYLLGRLYQLGRLDQTPDYTLAKQWYARAQNAYAPAAIALGFVYDTVEDQYSQAQTSYQIAADQNSPIGAFNLGLMYEEGKGQPVDQEKARKLYQMAADQGYAKAMVRLAGIDFNQGASPQEALHWYQMAAEKHDRDALYQLGLLSETGIGLKLDYANARHYYEQSAELGNQQAMLAMARMAQYGIGISKNTNEAATYYKKLASLGNAFGQYQLATLYDEKLLPETKKGEGRKWLEEALRNGSPQANKTMQWQATQKPGQLSYIESVSLSQTPLIASQPVELLYMDALNHWNGGDETQSKLIFNRIRTQYPDYMPAKRVVEQMRLG